MEGFFDLGNRTFLLSAPCNLAQQSKRPAVWLATIELIQGIREKRTIRFFSRCLGETTSGKSETLGRPAILSRAVFTLWLSMSRTA